MSYEVPQHGGPVVCKIYVELQGIAALAWPVIKYLLNIHIFSPACSHANKQQVRLSNLSLNGGPGTRTPGAETAHQLHCRFHCAHASSY